MRKLHETGASRKKRTSPRAATSSRARKVKEEALARLAKDFAALGERSLDKLESPRGRRSTRSPTHGGSRAMSLSTGSFASCAAPCEKRAGPKSAPDWTISWSTGRCHASARTSAGTHEREWLVRLVGEGAPALEELVALHPTADRKHLRQLVRNVQTSNVQRRKRAEEKLASALRFLLKTAELRELVWPEHRAADASESLPHTPSPLQFPRRTRITLAGLTFRLQLLARRGMVAIQVLATEQALRARRTRGGKGRARTAAAIRADHTTFGLARLPHGDQRLASLVAVQAIVRVTTRRARGRRAPEAVAARTLLGAGGPARVARLASDLDDTHALGGGAGDVAAGIGPCGRRALDA